MLSGDQFTFPSGYSISLQSIVNGFITVDLKNSEFGRNRIFRDIFSDDPDKVAQQTAEWRLAGIKYDPAKKYELRLPVRNMNDVLHAHFFWASSFGNEKIGIDTEYGTVRVYAGLDGEDRIFPLSTSVTGSDFSPGMAKLKEEAKAQQARGHSCMHVVTEASTKTIDGKDETFSHAETLDIAALLALDPDNMEIGKAYSIGDRNSAVRNPFPQNPSHDIFHLAVKKVDNTPTFEFGESQGSTFKKVNISSFWVYSVDIEEHDAEFWEQFRPQGQIP
jgi:hypothetical protein